MKRDETKDRFGRPGREALEPIEPPSIDRERERERRITWRARARASERERERMLMVARKHSSFEEEVGK